jgi:hypothetical protein
LAVYGLLAVCAVLVLLAREGSEEAEATVLTGRTTRGAEIVFTLVDGRLRGFRAQVAAWCPELRRWIEWPWAAAEFTRDGPHFKANARARNTDHTPPTRFVVSMQGRLVEDGSLARGKIHAVAARGSTVCEGTVRFSAD